jgi:tetratricopeptide (TPR) repeat protein
MTAPASTVIEKNTLPSSHGDPAVPNQPLSVKTATFQPVQSASLAPMPVLVPVAANAPQPSAQVAARWLPPAAPDDASMTASGTTVVEKNNLPSSRRDGPSIRNQPRLVKTITIQTRQSASVAPMPEPVPVAATTPQPNAQVAARLLPPAPPTDQAGTVIASAEPMPSSKIPAALAFSESAPKKIEAPKLALTFRNRGVAYANKGDYDRALADFNEAIRLDPKSARAFGNRGVLYVHKGDYNKALADFNEAIRLDPNNALAFCNRGRAKRNINDANGNADIAKARQLDPSVCQ